MGPSACQGGPQVSRAHLRIWGNPALRALSPVCPPCACSWLAWYGRTEGVEGSRCIVFTSCTLTHMTWLEIRKGHLELGFSCRGCGGECWPSQHMGTHCGAGWRGEKRELLEKPQVHPRA